MTEARLRSLYARAALERAPVDREGCPAPEELLALADGSLADHVSREPLVDHLTVCPACRRDYDVLRVMEEAATPRRVGRSVALALAASIALLVGATFLWRGSSVTEGPGPLRGGEKRPVDLVAPVGTLSAGKRVEFVWRSRADRPAYELELLGPDGRVLFARRTADTSIVLPDSVHLAGADYQWTLRARGAEGTQSAAAFGRFAIR
jgi:hypothetical protein